VFYREKEFDDEQTYPEIQQTENSSEYPLQPIQGPIIPVIHKGKRLFHDRIILLMPEVIKFDIDAFKEVFSAETQKHVQENN
jgi:hypothetical protein